MPTELSYHTEIRKWADKLCYLGSNNWFPLSSWVQYYLELGAMLPDLRNDGQKCSIVLAVPTRMYAAAMIGCGLIIMQINARVQDDDVKYLHHIQSLELGTPVTLLERNKKLKARYEGTKVILNKQYIWLMVEKATWKGIPIEEIRRIKLLAGSSVVSLPKQQRGRNIQPISPLILKSLDYRIATEFALATWPECLLIGQRAELETEIQQSRLGYQTSSAEYVHGVLQDILRVREFLPIGAAYRTSLISAHSASLPDMDGAFPPYAIFDGANGFLILHDNLRNVHRVIILDRTERHFEDAIELIKQEYATQRIDIPMPLQNTLPPPGVEQTMYWLSI